MPIKNLIGQKFGKLTVVEDSGKRASNGGVIWKCLCDCGNYAEVAGNNLTRKNNPTISCGCHSTIKDLAGKTFNLLTAIKLSENKSADGGARWICRCACGNEHEVSAKNLQSGAVKSCGCLKHPKIKKITRQKENFSGQIFNNWTILEKTSLKRNNYFLYKAQCNCGNVELKTIPEIKKSKGKCSKCRENNLIGKVFTKLTVLEKVGKDEEKRQALWLCQCECGNTVIVNSSNLIWGNTKSCGCLRASAGEYNITKILKEHNIMFETQKTFDTCIFKETNQYARFDFFLPEYNCLIEYDGQQHFKQVQGWEPLKTIQQRDRFKNKWCEENNIRLIHIPYTDFHKISWKYLKNKIMEED